MSAVISRYALFFVIGTVVLLAVTNDLLSPSPYVIIAQFLAVSTAVWARRSFPANTFRVDSTPSAGIVIRSGPYRLIRHPMYSAALLLIWAAVLSHISLWTITVGLLVLVIVVLRVVYEERYLCELYPDYTEYMKVTKAIIPFII